jgi:hypothetical protein
VLSLYDPEAGANTPVVPARPGLLSTYTSGPATSPDQAADLRSYLLADLIRRVAERHRLLVGAWRGDGEPSQAVQTDCDAMNIHPAAASPQLPDPLDIGIGPGPAGTASRWLQGGPVRPAGGALASRVAGPYSAALAEGGLDPLALRLVFLQQHYRQPVDLSWDDLAAADRALRQWRELVAGWANSPSKPMCAQYTGDIKAAFDDDLDTPAALRTLAALAADGEIPPGSKFESFAHLDHLLGLDLARDIGR